MLFDGQCHQCGREISIQEYYQMPSMPIASATDQECLCEDCVAKHPCWCVTHKRRHLVFYARDKSHFCPNCANDEIEKKGDLYFIRVIHCAERTFTERAFRRFINEVRDHKFFAELVVEHARRRNIKTGKLMQQILREKSVEVLRPYAPVSL